MTTIPSIAIALHLLLAIASSSPATLVLALGSGATIAVSYGTGTVCGIVAGEANRRVACYREGRTVSLVPNTSYAAIAGGRSSFCGVRSGGYSLLCWDSVGWEFQPKRIYRSQTERLGEITVGDDQVCGISNVTGAVKCWRGGGDDPSISDLRFDSISSGLGFSCGILRNSWRVRCWGNNSVGAEIESQFGNAAMKSIVVGESHACGVNVSGFVICKGSDVYGRLNAPAGSPWEYAGIAVGAYHSCAIRQPSGSAVCWGGGGEEEYSFPSPNATSPVSLVSIVAGFNFTCGLTTRNLSIVCWGPGWPNRDDLPLPTLLPGPCVQSSCSDCGIFARSGSLCSGAENICLPHCLPPPSLPPNSLPPGFPPPPPPSWRRRSSKALSGGLLAFAIVGSVGCLIGICTVVYCLWTGVCCGNKRIHNSVQPTIVGVRGLTNSNSVAVGAASVNSTTNSPPSRSSTIRRQGSRIMRRQRSGPSTTTHNNNNNNNHRAEEFSLAVLAAATGNFSLENKIGAGSFGVVYRGKLEDGREVAIKRGETGGSKAKNKRFQEKESAYESELSFLSRLHHKHLVRLVGFCEEEEEKLLVYEYMKNGSLYDHIHGKDNVGKRSSVVNSWKMRIQISLDAARGIEYLHNYAVPPIIHRDIKSSNILLDSNWTARVSDFGLSLMGPQCDADRCRPVKAAGTVGYIDPEYYGLNMVTAKSDVYGLGVVLLELITGKRAIFKDQSASEGGVPVSIVDFAVPAIKAGELNRVLDTRPGSPEVNEAEAVELVAYTAMMCVNLEGRERPSATDIVANLERALALCQDSHGSISSGGITVLSD